MWKSLKPGDRVSLGDTIRHISSLSKTAFGEKAYEVVRTELHYFEIMVKKELEDSRQAERKIIRYMDIGYHFLVEIWLDQFANNQRSHSANE